MTRIGDPLVVGKFEKIVVHYILLTYDQLSVFPFIFIQLRLEPFTELLSAKLLHILDAHFVLLAAHHYGICIN
jgi:hypothetical protein